MKYKTKNTVSNCRAMTLVEILVAVSILVVVMIAITAFEYDVFNYNRSSQTTLINIQDAENILKYMSKELRTMSPSASGSYPILNAATDTITFFADVNGDGAKEQVRYYVASTTLYRGITEPSGSPPGYNITNEQGNIIVSGFRNGTSTDLFQYYDDAYDGTTAALGYPLTISSIRLVRINIRIDSDPMRSPAPIIYSTQVTLRNLKDNL